MIGRDLHILPSLLAGELDRTPAPVDGAPPPRRDVRAERRAAGLCIGCARPSRTQRCPECRAKVEANTTRFRGQGRQGRIPKAAVSAKDVALAVRELTAAHHELERQGEPAFDAMPARERKLAEAEAVAHLALAHRFVGEVLARHGYAPPEHIPDGCELEVAP